PISRSLVETLFPYTTLFRSKVVNSFGMVIAQIAVIDIVFSLDSVITAVGMVDHIPVMVAAILIAVAIMIFAANPLGNFIDNHPRSEEHTSELQSREKLVCRV